ncbi:hypothetical protein MBLNU457_6990t1 [Dothideomycetes sp. NU457]
MPSRSYLAQWLNRPRPGGKWPHIAEIEIVINLPMRIGKSLEKLHNYPNELREGSEYERSFASDNDEDGNLPQSEKTPEYRTESIRGPGQDDRAGLEDENNGVPVCRLPPADSIAAQLPRSKSTHQGRVRPAEMSILFWQAIYGEGWICTKRIIEKVVELLHDMGKEVPQALDVSLGRFLKKASDFFFQIEDNDGVLWVTSDTST